MLYDWPVMNSAASLARKRSRRRCLRVREYVAAASARRRAITSSSERCWRGMEVLAEPGQIALTVMPSESDFAGQRFDESHHRGFRRGVVGELAHAVVADSRGETEIIRPLFCARMAGTNSRQQRKLLPTLMLIVRSQSSSVRSTTDGFGIINPSDVDQIYRRGRNAQTCCSPCASPKFHWRR